MQPFILLAVFSSLAILAQGLGAGNSCQAFILPRPNVLAGWCNMGDGKGTINITEINLGDCLGMADDGHVICVKK